MKKKKQPGFLIGFIAVIGLGFIILFLPPVWSRVSYYWSQVYASIKYKLNPPQEDVFVPGQDTDPTVAAMVQQTLVAMVSPTPDLPTATLEASPTPTNTPIPLPSPILLTGIEEELQGMNNCAPTTMSMNLSYWRWVGNQYNIADVVKPYKNDKNVMPYELVDYVNDNTEFNAVTRVGGDLYTLKALINAGIPVMVEKGFYVPSTQKHPNMGWMGHYELVNGYNDEKGIFYTHDSYLPLIVGTDEAIGLDFTFNDVNRNFEIPYDTFYEDWRAFNYVFIVVYPGSKENDVINLLGPLWNEEYAIQLARDRARSEAATLTDPYQQYFAWFNLGSSLVKQQNYTDAAAAYDQAFLLVPNIDSDHRPYRNIWYQTGPYFAYYNVGRYQDVIELATNTLDKMSEPILEESYYWRAMAEVQTGRVNEAIADLRKALEYHANFSPAVEELKALGETP
jgi:hypothetical protein